MKNDYTMTTFAGIFFSIISVLGLLKGKSKRAMRRIVIVAFSVFLILVQILFMNDILDLGGQEFIVISGFVSGIILILSFQRNEAW
ncbi:MAG TPA: hypothetical protein VI233_11860 [Puia sp.]